MQKISATERLGTAIGLLSLDRIVPYYTEMGLTPSQEHAESIKQCIREAIEAIRTDFFTNKNSIPTLEAHVEKASDRRFGPAGRIALFQWLENDFVHVPGTARQLFRGTSCLNWRRANRYDGPP